MLTQPIDKQSLKLAILELIQTDTAFLSQLRQLLQECFSATTEEQLSYRQTLPIERRNAQKAFKEKYEKKGGMKWETIVSLQKEFEDDPYT